MLFYILFFIAMSSLIYCYVIATLTNVYALSWQILPLFLLWWPLANNEIIKTQQHYSGNLKTIKQFSLISFSFFPSIGLVYQVKLGLRARLDLTMFRMKNEPWFASKLSNNISNNIIYYSLIISILTLILVNIVEKHFKNWQDVTYTHITFMQ